MRNEVALLEAATLQFVAQLAARLDEIEKPKTWRFVVSRDSDGAISEVVAAPI